MHPELRSQLDQLKTVHTPRADFVHSLETRLAEAPVVDPVTDHFPAQIKHVFERAVQLFLPAQFVPMANRLAAIVLVLGVTAGGWVSMVSATYNTVPGDTLYNVKRATEKVQIVAAEATGNNIKAAALHTDFAERRVAEVKQVISENKSPEQAKTAVSLLTKSLASASEALKEAGANESQTPAEQLEAASRVLSNTERIAASLANVLDTLPPNIIGLIDELVTVQGTVTDQRLSALQDIVRVQLESAEANTTEDLNQIIITALMKVSEESRSIALRAQELPDDAPEAVSTSTDEGTASTIAVDSVSVNTTSSDTLVSTTIADTSSTASVTLPDVNINDATPVDIVPHIATLSKKDINELSSAVQEDVQQVSNLIESGNLIDALEKAKEVTLKQRDIEVIVKKAALTTQHMDAKQVPATTNTPAIETASTATPETADTTSTSIPTDPSSN